MKIFKTLVHKQVPGEIDRYLLCDALIFVLGGSMGVFNAQLRIGNATVVDWIEQRQCETHKRTWRDNLEV